MSNLPRRRSLTRTSRIRASRVAAAITLAACGLVSAAVSEGTEATDELPRPIARIDVERVKERANPCRHPRVPVEIIVCELHDKKRTIQDEIVWDDASPVDREKAPEYTRVDVRTGAGFLVPAPELPITCDQLFRQGVFFSGEHALALLLRDLVRGAAVIRTDLEARIEDKPSYLVDYEAELPPPAGPDAVYGVIEGLGFGKGWGIARWGGQQSTSAMLLVSERNLYFGAASEVCGSIFVRDAEDLLDLIDCGLEYLPETWDNPRNQPAEMSIMGPPPLLILSGPSPSGGRDSVAVFLEPDDPAVRLIRDLYRKAKDRGTDAEAGFEVTPSPGSQIPIP